LWYHGISRRFFESNSIHSLDKEDEVNKRNLRPELKLKLNRETLLILEQSQLGAVVGGDVLDPDTVTIRCSNCGSCNTGV
jgi:hypothetical protein